MLVPMNHTTINLPSFHGQAISKGLKKTISEIEIAVGKRIFEAAMRSEVISKDDLFTQAEMVKLKGQFQAAKKKDLPPVVTHNIIDGDVRAFSSSFLREGRS